MTTRRIIPRLCLSTILIEIGIICALVAVNSRPISFVEVGEDKHDAQYQKAHARDLVKFNNDLGGQDDDDYTHPPEIFGGEYGWPWTFLQSNSEKGISNFRVVPLVGNIAVCLLIVVATTIFIEVSIYATRQRIKLQRTHEVES